jgi:hypothetical protein
MINLLKQRAMKTMILSAAMMILMISAPGWSKADTTSVNPPDEASFDASVRLKPSAVIEFRVINPENEKVTLRIVGEHNNKLFERKVKGDEALRLACDMSDFGKGTYTCVVEKNGKPIVRKDITLGR